jgi:hypothetical protein
MILKRTSVLLGLIVPLAFFSAQAKADSLKVYVGYADSLRPSGFFPNPFAGSSNVVYSGMDPSTGALDSGAIRITDTGSTALTITNLTVTLNPGSSPTTFALWGSVTVNPGQQAIYAQTTQYNFDSSDYGFLPTIGIDSTHPVGGCTNLAALSATQQNDCVIDAPTVSFTANGVNYSYIDSGNVLDTFGYDFISGSSDGNESINWNPIGSFVGRGGTTTPEPASFALLGLGLIAAGAGRRLFRKA